MNPTDEEFIIEPLTMAELGEPVICTPKKILLHPAYNGGWKVLRRFRADGITSDLVMTHSFLSFFHDIIDFPLI